MDPARTADAGPAAPRPRGQFARTAGWLASAAILVATVLLLRDRTGAVGQAGGLPGPLPAAGAVVCYVAANVLLADTWRRVVTLAGGTIRWGAAVWVWAVSQLARYTVGAAQIGGRAVAGRRYGLTATVGAVTTLVEVGWQTAITATLVLATLPWWLPGAGDLTWLGIAGVVPAVVLALGLAAPLRLLRGVASVLAALPFARARTARLARAAERVDLSRRAAADLTLRFAANTALRLFAFGLLFVAVGGDPAADGLLAVGGYAVGQLAGRLAVFAPGGVGPREGATALVLASAVGGGPALVLVAATRLLEIVGELAFFGLARALRGPPARTGV